MVSSLSSSFFVSFRLPICFHILFLRFLFSIFFVVVLFRRFFVSFVFGFSATDVHLWYNVHNTKTNVDELHKARPSPLFETTLREAQVVATRCTMSVTFPLCGFNLYTTPGTLRIVGISGRGPVHPCWPVE